MNFKLKECMFMVTQNKTLYKIKFEKIISQYSDEIIDKNNLYNKLSKYFMVLLENNMFFDLDFLKIYPFISELQDEDIYEDDILKIKLNEIKDIISGKKDFSYGIWMQLMKENVEDIFLIWDMYKENNFILYEKLLYIEKKLKDIKVKTIGDIIKKKILMLMSGLPTVNDDIYINNLLYMENIKKERIIKEIDNLFDVILKQNPIFVILEYSNQGFNILV